MGKSSYTSRNGSNYSIQGGKYTGYTYTDKDTGKSGPGAFDDPADAMSHIEREERWQETLDSLRSDDK